MKRLLAAGFALVALNASAFTPNGNEAVGDARAFLNCTSASSCDIAPTRYWQGVVAGLSSVYAEEGYILRVCYPKGATLGQLAEIAANYVIEHPEKRTESLNVLVWRAHREAFGSGDCEVE